MKNIFTFIILAIGMSTIFNSCAKKSKIIAKTTPSAPPTYTISGKWILVYRSGKKIGNIWERGAKIEKGILKKYARAITANDTSAISLIFTDNKYTIEYPYRHHYPYRRALASFDSGRVFSGGYVFRNPQSPSNISEENYATLILGELNGDAPDALMGRIDEAIKALKDAEKTYKEKVLAGVASTDSLKLGEAGEGAGQQTPEKVEEFKRAGKIKDKADATLIRFFNRGAVQISGLGPTLGYTKIRNVGQQKKILNALLRISQLGGDAMTQAGYPKEHDLKNKDIYLLTGTKEGFGYDWQTEGIIDYDDEPLTQYLTHLGEKFEDLALRLELQKRKSGNNLSQKEVYHVHKLTKDSLIICSINKDYLSFDTTANRHESGVQLKFVREGKR